MPYNLSPTQKNILDCIINRYNSNESFTGKIIFTAKSAYTPPKFYFSKTYEFSTCNKILAIINEYSTGVRQHDGFVFIDPKGTTTTGCILDATELINVFPKTINASTAANAFMKLVTKYNQKYVKCAVISTRKLSVYYKGTEHKIGTNLVETSLIERNHNYGMALFISDNVLNTDAVKFIKMKGFGNSNTLPTSSKLIHEILSIAYDPLRHDGFWHYNPKTKIISGPYLVVTKTHPEHLTGIGGMKRLTAKILAHSTNSTTLILREGSSELLAFGDINKLLLSKLQRKLEALTNQSVPVLEIHKDVLVNQS